MCAEAQDLRPHPRRIFERAPDSFGVRPVLGLAAAAGDAQDHHAGTVRARCRDPYAVIPFGRDQARHQRAVAGPAYAFALGRDDRIVVDEVPAVHVVDITIAVVVDARLAVRFALVRPQLVAQVGVRDVGPVVEQRDGDRLARRALAPDERAGDVVHPPFVTVPVAAVVRRRIVDVRGRDQRGAGERAARVAVVGVRRRICCEG